MTTTKKRTMSPEHRAAISAAMKARHARDRAEAAVDVPTDAPPRKRTGRRLSHQGGKHAHREAASRARIIERRARAWRLFVGGDGMGTTTMEDVAKAIGVSKATVWHYIHDVADELNKQVYGHAEVLRAQQASQIASVLKAHLPRREKEASARIVLQALDRQARLFNLDLRPPDAAFSPDQLVALMKGIAELFMSLVADPDLRRQFVDGLRRRLGSGSPATIDVEKTA